MADMVISAASGIVASFDSDVGLGAVTTTAGDTYQFHCTSIVDGSRSIETGQSVTFSVAPRGLGSAEAINVVKV